MSDQAETGSASSPTSETPEGGSSPKKQKVKIDILLKATGDAPIMKQRKWAVERAKTVGWVMDFIRRYLKLEAGESLFIYVNQSFSPAPDVEIGTVYDCFGSDNKVVLHYCLTQAWG